MRASKISVDCIRFFIIVLAVGLCSSAFPIVGIGAHYGIDLTQKMDNALMEQTDFGNFKFSLGGLSVLPDTFKAATILTGKDIPVFINRKNWENTGINFGGKLYVDVIPFVDALEISTNFGVWQYDGSVLYPKSISVKNNPPSGASKFEDFVNIDYDTMAISLKNLFPNRFFWGVTGTPYAKLHFDVTLRKYILQIPPVIKSVKFYGGLGMSIDFATPILSSHLIESALGSSLAQQLSLAQMGPQLFNNQEIMKKIIDKIIGDLMTPHYGMHLALGTMIKPPMIPVGFYIDAKYIIQFDNLDKYVDIGGSGFLFNIGAALAF